MEFMPESQWQYDRSVFKRGKGKGARQRSRNGQITYKGRVAVQETNSRGETVVVPRHRFLVRVGKIASRLVVGTITDAERALHELLAECSKGFVVKRSCERLDSFLIGTYLPGRDDAGCAPKTLQGYRESIENHIVPAVGSHTLANITTELLQKFVQDLRNEKGLNPKTIRNIFAVLSAALNQAARLGRIGANPAKLVELAKLSNVASYEKQEANKRKAWSRDEMEVFFVVAPSDAEMTRWGVIGASTGMRPGEQCARKWSDWTGRRLLIDSAVAETDKAARKRDPSLERWVMASTKTRATRQIRLSEEAIRALREQKAHVDRLRRAGKITAEQAEYIFPAYKGSQPFSNPAKIYNRWCLLITGKKRGREYHKASLPGVRFITPYGLRHTHATDLLRHGQNVKFVADRLGTSIEMIENHYGHILQDMEDQAIDDLPLLGYSGAA